MLVASVKEVGGLAAAGGWTVAVGEQVSACLWEAALELLKVRVYPMEQGRQRALGVVPWVELQADQDAVPLVKLMTTFHLAAVLQSWPQLDLELLEH